MLKLCVLCGCCVFVCVFSLCVCVSQNISVVEQVLRYFT